MKIVHLETGRHFLGGAQQVIWLLEGLEAKGVQCVLVCPPEADIDTIARASGLNVSNLPIAGDHDLAFAWRLRALLKKEQPDLLHCHSRRGADLLGGWAARLAGVRAVLSRRVDNPESRIMARLRYRPFEAVVAISENIALLLIENGLDPTRLAVIRDAVDPEAINQEPDRSILKTEFDIAEGDFAIAVVAQLIRRKGHRFLLDVLPGLLEEHAHIRVVFFGEGEGEADLRALTNKLHLSRYVRFAGFRHDLDDYLGAFDLLVHPAEQEGLGVAMLKGAAAGLPVIAFDVAGAREAVVHGRTGVLIEPGDFAKLQRAIEVMVEDEDIRQDLGHEGRQRMKEDFSVATMVDSHIALYERLLHE